MINQVDGDVVVYQCGFASDTTIYQCSDGVEFNYKKEAAKHCANEGLSLSDVTKRVEAEPIEHCLHSVKLFLSSIKASTDADSQQIFLTGKGQWRDEVFPDYKANRDRTHKPVWFEEIKEYLTNVHGAITIIGDEADDAMAIAQWKDRGTRKLSQLQAESCICTIDKDLSMVPGWHYNWNANGGKGDMFWVDEDMGNRLFFEQWLSGDTADNIPGVPRVGVKTAVKLLEGYNTVEEMYTKVMEEWRTHTNHDDAYIHMIGDLLWMQRTSMEGWDMFYGYTEERNDALKS